MTARDNHGSLPGHANRLLERLEAIEGLTLQGRVGHMQHMDHARRLHQLAHHLRAALRLSESHHYASALVVVRAALEHHLLDRLVLLANRHIVTYTKAKKNDAARWEADIRSLQASGSDIAGWFWDQAGLNVVHRGLHSNKSKKGRGQTISSWYFEADRYDPFVGPKRHAGRLAAPFWEKRLMQQIAEEQASAWKVLFRHDAVMKHSVSTGSSLGYIFRWTCITRSSAGTRIRRSAATRRSSELTRQTEWAFSTTTRASYSCCM